MMIEIRRIDAQHKSDINIPNEAFHMFGRIIPSFNNGHWTYKLGLLILSELWLLYWRT